MKVGIVGGEGEMGRVFLELLRGQGAECKVSDLNTAVTNQDIVKECETVIFSLPISKAVPVIESLVGSSTSGQLFVDLTSIKTPAVNAMLKSKGEVLGLHPMFGPGLKKFAGQVAIACKARTGEKAEKFLKMLQSAGLTIKDSSAEEHDRMMAVVQGLNHINTVVMARTLSELGIDLKESLEYSSPIYRMRILLISRIMAQSAELYADIALANEHNLRISEVWQRCADEMTKIIQSGNREGFLDYFKTGADYFEDLSREATSATNLLIETFGELSVKK